MKEYILCRDKINIIGILILWHKMVLKQNNWDSTKIRFKSASYYIIHQWAYVFLTLIFVFSTFFLFCLLFFAVNDDFQNDCNKTFQIFNLRDCKGDVLNAPVKMVKECQI